eukprot:GHVP01057973.1.p2 GENE.GHVP01057973.1~~GHVP01057973.1.p2  ORF type:complete len:111 (+),score=13.51 GHVP01057973.1:1450-1782(+)
MCVDFRRLNDITITDKHPIPHIQSILNKTRDGVWLSTLDIKQAFHTVSIKPGSVQKTTFSSPDGHYENERVPFVLKNSLSVFQRVDNSIIPRSIKNPNIQRAPGTSRRRT